MKPKISFHKKICELHPKVKPLSKYWKRWAYNNILPFAYYISRKTIKCLECEHKWKDNKILKTKKDVKCPNCKRKLTQAENLSWEREYFVKMEIYQDYQIMRIFKYDRHYKYRTKSPIVIEEVMQHWFDEKGNNCSFARPTMNLGSVYYDNFTSSPMSFRGNIFGHILTNLYGKIVPKATYLNVIYRNGFNGSWFDLNPYRCIIAILTNSMSETLFKACRREFFELSITHPDLIKKRWPSIRILLRNNYRINYISDEHAKDWLDHLDLLEYFSKDLRSPKYLCPEHFGNEHLKYIRKKKAHERKKRLNQLKREIKKANKRYEKKKKKYGHLIFKNDKFEIRMLSSVEEFMEEGDEHNHCIFESEYYDIEDSLLFTAQMNKKRIETVEVSISEKRVVAARGLDNKPTKYHNEIVALVNKELNKIKL